MLSSCYSLPCKSTAKDVSEVSEKLYDAKFRTKVVRRAEEIGNRTAGRECGIGETSVHEWRKDSSRLADLPRKKMASRFKKEGWPEQERDLSVRARAHGSSGKTVSKTKIRLKAKILPNEKSIENFCEGALWCYRFMKGNNLVVRVRTAFGRGLPSDWESKVASFHSYVRKASDIASFLRTHFSAWTRFA